MENSKKVFIAVISVLLVISGIFIYNKKTNEEKLGGFWEESSPDDFETAKDPEVKNEISVDDSGRQYITSQVPSSGYAVDIPSNWEEKIIGDTIYLTDGKNSDSAIEVSLTTLNGVISTEQRVMEKADDFVFGSFRYHHPNGVYKFTNAYYMEPKSVFDDNVKVWYNQDDPSSYIQYPIDQKPEGVSVEERSKLIGFKHAQDNSLSKEDSITSKADLYTSFMFVPIQKNKVVMISVIAPAGFKSEVDVIASKISGSVIELDDSEYYPVAVKLNKREKVDNFSFFVSPDMVDVKSDKSMFSGKFSNDPSNQLFNSTMTVMRLDYPFEDDNLLSPKTNAHLKLLPFFSKTSNPSSLIVYNDKTKENNLTMLSHEEGFLSGNRKALYVEYLAQNVKTESINSPFNFPKPFYGQMMIIKDGNKVYAVNLTHPENLTDYFKKTLDLIIRESNFE